MHLRADSGLKTCGKVRTDSSAAIGIAFRAGLGGRARHIRVQYLWIQEVVSDRGLQLEKVGTKENVADAMTKHLAREALEEHLATMGFCAREGRSDEAIALRLLRPQAKGMRPWGV